MGDVCTPDRDPFAFLKCKIIIALQQAFVPFMPKIQM
jgi:hypothetical protein